MSFYIKLSTLEYPRHEGDIRLEHPEIPDGLTGDEFPCPDTYAKVKMNYVDSYDYMRQKIIPQNPKLVNGEWVCDFTLVDLTADEIAELVKQKEMANPLLSKKGSQPNVVL